MSGLPGTLIIRLSLGLVVYLIYLQLILSTELIPERAEIYYVNEKYAKNVTAYIRRTGRRSPYYFNLGLTTLDWCGDNVSLHGVFYEYLHNEYKRSFVELDLNLCDVIKKEPWRSAIGTTLEARGFICPLPSGTYKFHNMSVSLANFPYVVPFEKVMLQGYAKLTTTQQILSTEVIPEGAEIYYVNEKYMKNVTVYIRRTGRRSPYYFNADLTTLDWFGDNVSLHGVFYEYLHNEYKRSFVELDLNLCDMIKKEPWRSAIGTTLKAKGFICPLPSGTYKFHNISVSLANFPYVVPFEKVMLQGYAKLTTTQQILVRVRFYMSFKRNTPK